MTTSYNTALILQNRQLRREVEARLDHEALDRPRSSNAAGAPNLPCPRCNGRTHPTLDEVGAIDREHRHCLMCGDVRVVPLKPDLLDEVLPEGFRQGPRSRVATHMGARL